MIRGPIFFMKTSWKLRFPSPSSSLHFYLHNPGPLGSTKTTLKTELLSAHAKPHGFALPLGPSRVLRNELQLLVERPQISSPLAANTAPSSPSTLKKWRFIRETQKRTLPKQKQTEIKQAKNNKTPTYKRKNNKLEKKPKAQKKGNSHVFGF